jgi:ElaB/YqjD/DUF883 family membrane-anchored ribosome-binding protein
MAKRSMDKELDALRGDMTKLSKDMSRLVSAVGASGRSKLSDTGDRLETGFEDVLELIRARGKSTIKATNQGISQRPITAVATAFGAGLLLGKLMDRG